LKKEVYVNPYLDEILTAAATAKDVRISISALTNLVRDWAEDSFPIPDWRAPVFPQTDDDTFINFLGVGNAINFCFTSPATKKKYETEYMGAQWRGAFGMWAALARARDEGIPVLDPDFLEHITEKEARKIFRGNPPIPMLKERVTCLQSAGRSLKKHFGGSYAGLFRNSHFAAFHNGQGIVEQLTAHDPCWRDATLQIKTALNPRFHKRANLFVMMYDGRAMNSDGRLTPIIDSAELTPPADYEIPKALRELGILRYDDELSQMVDRQDIIPKNSVWEQEIRAQTVAAMHSLTKILSLVRGERITIAALDYKVWSAGRTSTLPHHLTSTIAY